MAGGQGRITFAEGQPVEEGNEKSGQVLLKLSIAGKQYEKAPRML
jgi:hypothetical protein